MTVAAGNNGERDKDLGFDRIQVPADSVNALTVGASDRTTSEWARANYSARGPGRSPGRRKPDVLAFGGSGSEYFHVAVSDVAPRIAPNLGTSFASPLALRSAAGVSAFLGDDVHPLTIKALLIHSCEARDGLHPHDIGWGLVPSDLTEIITCGEGVARIIYQGKLNPGKYLRAPVPCLPTK
ncbi:S8 family serine peptidase [Oryzomicrobium sp.]|uniref:S8 family serine peptidase n=1 Tax=Oryzomicrobium sp. TaxID=1911578 RepID=UPI0025E342D1|nr:S8 family serine peptidase [Oryzomicrobium sp.]MCE1243651.1 S8 family serine peptidase [Oryzomicrobium sp.]